MNNINMIEEFKNLSNKCDKCNDKICDKCELYLKLIELFHKIRKDHPYWTISYTAEQLDIGTIDALSLDGDRDKFIKE